MYDGVADGSAVIVCCFVDSFMSLLSVFLLDFFPAVVERFHLAKAALLAALFLLIPTVSL